MSLRDAIAAIPSSDAAEQVVDDIRFVADLVKAHELPVYRLCRSIPTRSSSGSSVTMMDVIGGGFGWSANDCMALPFS